MMATCASSCDEQTSDCVLCKKQGNTSKGTKYCFNCLEKICNSCFHLRHGNKQTENHMYIDITEQFGEADEGNKILQMISKHVLCSSHPDEMIKFFCQDDKEFCCVACAVVSHRKCSHVVEVEKLVQGKDVSNEVKRIEDMVFNLSLHANVSIDAMNTCLTENEKQAETVIETLKDIREKINKILDAFEKNCIDSSKSIVKKESTRISQETEKLRNDADLLDIYRKVLETINRYGSARQKHITAKKLEDKIMKRQSILLDQRKDFRLTKHDLKQEKPLLDFLQINNTEILGRVEETIDELHLPPFDVTDLLRDYNIVKTDEITYRGFSAYTYSIAFLPDDKVYTNNDTGRCLLATRDGTVQSSCDFSSVGATGQNKPYCVTVVKPDMVAVSIPELKKICFVTITGGQLRIKNFVETKYKPRAICGLKNGEIAVGWGNPAAFGIVTVEGDQVKDKVYFCQDKSGRQLQSFDFIALDERRAHVIQSCTRDRAVYCFDFEGNPKFKYTNPELQSPRGVALDRDGNVYVCDPYSAAIHMISPTGVAIRVVRDGVPSWPLAIAFNKDGKEFAVSNYYTQTFFRLQKTS